MTKTKANAVKDCRGVGCPMNLVYLKVELAKLQSGEVLEIFMMTEHRSTTFLLQLKKRGTRFWRRYNLMMESGRY